MYAPVSGRASPKSPVFFETSDIPLVEVMQLYERDPTCKSSVDLLAASTVGMGFYTTCEQGQEKAKAALASAQADYEKRQEEARKEAQAVIAQASQVSERVREEILAEARKEAQAVVAKAREALAQAKLLDPQGTAGAEATKLMQKMK